MKRVKVCIIAGCLLVAATFTSVAEAEISLGADLRFFTSVFTQKGSSIFYPHSAGDFYFIKGEARLKAEGSVGDRLDFFLRTDFIYYDFPSVSEPVDLEGYSWSRLVPVDLRLYEAYAVFRDFPFPGIDVTVGKERLKWGKADKLHVIDNINPSDLANFFTFDPDYFGESIPTPLVDFRWYCTDYVNLELVYTLSFKPASFPPGFWEIFRENVAVDLSAQMGVPQNAVDISTVISLPEWNIYSTPFGIRIFGNIFNVDYALSYYRGYIDMPLPRLSALTFSPHGVTVAVTFEYPEVQVLGLEWSGELGGVGYWGEIGFYFPERYTFSYSAGILQSSVKVLKRFYVKAILGFDYTFPVGEGLYVNFQYVHGFFDEMNYTGEAKREPFSLGKAGFESEIEDYYLLSFEQSFYRETLKAKLSFLLNVGNYGDFSTSHAYAVMPGLEWKPVDGLTLKAGAMFIDGKNGSKFGLFRKFDMVYLLAEASF